MPEPTLSSKELRGLRKKFKRGFTLEATSRGNSFRILDPQGKPVHRDGSSAPLLLHSTPLPSELVNIEHDLNAAGVLRTNGKRRVTRTDEAEARRREAFVEMTKARSEKRRVEAEALKERMENVLRPLGGVWMRGAQADVSHIGAMIAREQGQTQMTPDLLVASISRVLHGGWVEPRYQEVWNEFARRLEEADDIHDTFFALVREARGLPEDHVEVRRPVEGDWPFRVELLPLEALLVDHDYQRPVPWPFVRKIAARYDESLIGTIDVSERRRGAVFAILDGQLRFEASRLVGKTTVWASIYSGLDKASEARFFLHKNKDRRAVHPFYTFRARVIADDPDAVEIEKIVKRNGYQLAIGAPNPATKSENHIAAIAAVEAAYEYIRPDDSPALAPTLETLKASTFGLEDGQNNVLIRGLARFFGAFEDDELDRRALVRAIQKQAPTMLLNKARETARYSGGAAASAMSRVLVEEYNKQVERTKRLPKDRL